MNTVCQRPLFATCLLLSAFLLGCGPSDSDPIASKNDNAPATDTDTDSSSKDSDAHPKKSKANNDSSTKSPSTKSPSTKTPSGMSGMAGMKKMSFPASADMKFKDDIDSNVDAPKNIGDLEFANPDGSKTKLSDYAGEKNVILVFTEGFNGMLCPFCQTQTSRLVSNYAEFQKRDCEVIVVYPGPEEHLDEFVKAALKTEKEQVDKVPFPIVLDKDFTATKFFDIKSMLAHPSTYLIDKQGAVQFAYVGNDMSADRPSVKAMLKRLDQLKK